MTLECDVIQAGRNLKSFRWKLLLPKPEVIQSDTKKRELLKNPTNVEEIQEKKIVDIN